jgi:SAM-dependent methyltransferase
MIDPPSGATQPQSWSHPATSQRAFACLEGLDWSKARVADVGAGRGHFSYLMGEFLRSKGIEPRDHVFPCDLIPESFEYGTLECQRIHGDGRLPFADASLDAAISIEVIEHVEDQFAFLRELARVVKPGGLVIVTTPNTLNANSRVRTLVWGFPLLFDPLPLDSHDPRLLAGHIHPISPYFLAYTALRSGLEHLEFYADRTKASAVVWTVLLSPVLWLGGLLNLLRLRRKHPEVAHANRALIRAQSNWETLTSRTTILRTRVADRATG